MINSQKSIWKHNNKFQIKDIKIILKDSILIHTSRQNKAYKQFILTRDKLFYLQGKKLDKYIDLQEVNVKFNNLEYNIIFLNLRKKFNWFFKDVKAYLKWKAYLKEYSILLEFNKNYKIIEQIGSSLNSKVFKAINIFDKKIYAIKYLKKKNYLKNEIFNEIKIMRKLDSNSYVIKIKEVYEDIDHFYLVLEYSNLNNLRNFFEKHQCYNKYSLIKNILNGINYIHKNNIIHRDIKPENILLNKENNGEITAKIGDFGTSFSLLDIPIYKKIGTLGYFAPEVLSYDKTKEFNFKYEIDIYSLGCLIYYIYFKKNIYNIENLDCLIKKNMENKFQFCKEFYNEDKELQDLISGCLNTDPVKRLAWKDILKYFN